MTARALVALALVAVPRPALACATCIGSAFGDRGFNWAFVLLMLTPLAVAAVVAGVLACVLGRRPNPVHPASSTEYRSC